MTTADGSRVFVCILTSNEGTTWHTDPDEARELFDELEELMAYEDRRFVRLESRWVDRAEFDRVVAEGHENEFGHLVVEVTEGAGGRWVS